MILVRIKHIDFHEWHPWFAWHPVRTTDAWVWLETVERRDKCSKTITGLVGPIWEWRRAYD